MNREKDKKQFRTPRFAVQRRALTRKTKKGTAVILSLAMLTGIGVNRTPFSSLGQENDLTQPISTVGETVTDYGLRNPRVEMQTRDCIEFGSYWQEDTNGDGKADKNDEKTPVKWQILSEEDTDGDGEVDDLFLLADQVLDAKAYNDKAETTFSDGYVYTDFSCTWETSTLRTWMNGEFYDALFTDEEKKAVKNTDVKNENNPYVETVGGNNTKDHLFLLSLSDIINTDYGFSDDMDYDDQARMAKTTAYAKENGTESYADGTVWWWLRSPGNASRSATFVRDSGDIYVIGYHVDISSGGVRPALHINVTNTQGSTALANKTTEEVALSKTTWDTVEFGTYNGVKITWRVLSVNRKDAFLLADRILLKKAYHGEYESITWENCDLRNWLNSSFLSESFSTEEQNAIKAITIKNEDNFYYETNGGNDTTDKVYLLSLSDIVNKAYGFPTAYWCRSSSRIAVPTDSKNGTWWLLRSPGIDTRHTSCVHTTGDVNYGDYDESHVDNSLDGVRPALHLDLSSSVWTKGKEVTSDDEKTAITDSLPSGDDETETTEPTDVPGGKDGKETTNPNSDSTGSLSEKNGTETTQPNENSDEPTNPAPTKTPEGTSGSAPTPTPIPTTTQTPTASSTGTLAPVPTNAASGEKAEKEETISSPAVVKSVKVTNKKAGKTIITFKKVSGAEGYQLQYAKNKKFTKAKKSKTTKKTTYTIKKLTKKTTYYFRVRAYVKDSSGKKVYGKWSAVKKVKIKK